MPLNTDITTPYSQGKHEPLGSATGEKTSRGHEGDEEAKTRTSEVRSTPRAQCHVHQPRSLDSSVAGACVGDDRENASMYTKDHVGESSNAPRNEADLALTFACDIKSELKRYCKVASWALNDAQCHQGICTTNAPCHVGKVKRERQSI